MRLAIVFTFLLSQIALGVVYSQCSGSYTTTNASCQPLLIGNGTPGYIRVCLETNNIPSGGGSSCNPGGACNPPFGGGGWPAGIRIYASNGTTHTGGILTTWTGISYEGSCFYVQSDNGYAYIYGLCLTAGTTFTWTTVNACGIDVCSGSSEPCEGPICQDCDNSCGTCGFETPPTVAEVIRNCDGYPYIPALLSNESSTRCHQFTAVDTEVDFNVIISSLGCSGGNVSAFSWELYSSSCGSSIQDGDLSSLTFTNLTPGETYTFCYTFTVPGSCTNHTIHTPYFIGAETVVLPVELIKFKGLQLPEKNKLSWSTATEQNNDFYTIEHSMDGVTWREIGQLSGVGNSSNQTNYQFIHKDFAREINYYRLSQTDFDGTTELLGVISIDNRTENELIKTVNLLGQEVDALFQGIVIDQYSDGTTVKRVQQ